MAARLAHPAGKGLPNPNPVIAAIDELIFETLHREPEFDDHVNETMLALAETLISKQADYGPHAINRAPGGPLMGVNVRLHDKLSRAINLLENETAFTPEHETLRDTYADLANYAVIALLLLDGNWPES